MQHLKNMELFERAIRLEVCTKCYQRPPGSETLSPAKPRECQGKCSIFRNLPRLAGIALRNDSNELSVYENGVRGLICKVCTLVPSAGEYCGDKLDRTCPLSRYLGDVVVAIQSVAERSRV